MEFKDVLYELRSARHLSQAKLAEKVGLSSAAIGTYENGTRMPSRETQEKLADFFNVSLDYLMGRDSKSIYYLNPETAETAQELFDNPDMRVLFDAVRDARPEDLKKAAEYLSFLKWGGRSDD